MLYPPPSNAANVVLAEKGSAAPSQDSRDLEPQAYTFVPNSHPEPTSESNLSDLIKRAPIHKSDERQVRGARPSVNESLPSSIDISVVGLIRRGPETPDRDGSIAAPSPVSVLKPARRKQLTVRISTDQFDRLREIAERTGRSYQDLQVSALARYLHHFD